MHVYLHLISTCNCLHVHVNMYVWSKLSRCFVFSQQPVKMFRLLSGDHACIFAFDKQVSTCTCEYVCMVKVVKMHRLQSTTCQDVSSFVR